VSAGIVAGIVLVFLLLAYLVYALIHARHSDGCSGIFAHRQLFAGAVYSGKAAGNAAGEDD